ncbi:hypothetical protein ACPCHQ_16930 [Ralstonia thomasii]|uniref:Uncharacterized protein n=2 Tax=Ralstonia TaxID=48736 RepID=A0ABN9JF54_9RALS|nr:MULTISPECIES: hypothetical protein [Ralstonia]MBT2177771.1 hypothetical protein [Ralstonia pickettii]CAJ0710659.1 hypothetical protein LMG7143_01671 [Ralstonia sp. LMG 18095]CAJ0806385.1 hypothetical protein LMG18095_04434 [Ralstonia sp. LMG 18095]
MKWCDQLALQGEENIRHIINLMEELGRPVGAYEVAEYLGKEHTTARGLLNRCVERGLAVKEHSSRKNIHGTRFCWRRTDVPYVPAVGLDTDGYNFADLLDVWHISAPVSPVRGCIHRQW